MSINEKEKKCVVCGKSFVCYVKAHRGKGHKPKRNHNSITCGKICSSFYLHNAWRFFRKHNRKGVLLTIQKLFNEKNQRRIEIEVDIGRYAYCDEDEERGVLNEQRHISIM